MSLSQCLFCTYMNISAYKFQCSQVISIDHISFLALSLQMGSMDTLFVCVVIVLSYAHMLIIEEKALNV